MKLEQARSLYLSLREQYLSDRPMTVGEESAMWSAWHILNELGWKWARITDEQLRTENEIDPDWRDNLPDFEQGYFLI